MNKFRPQSISKLHAIRMRLKIGLSENYNFQTRVQWHPVGWKPNQISISRRFGHLHYLACHAPAPIQQKWRMAYKQFCKRHFPKVSVSLRYINNYSCAAWL